MAVFRLVAKGRTDEAGTMNVRGAFLASLALLPLSSAYGQEVVSKGFDEKVDSLLEPIAHWSDKIVFFSVGGVPVVLILLAVTALFLTLFFKFINFRAFGLAIRTVKGKYSRSDDPGQITHFQALTTALSATVGLGNIAGVAVAIGIGGPGAVFWMVVMGFLGMTSKFTECTLGVKYRDIDSEGKVLGGGMRYLEKGLGERGFGGLGKALAIIFAVACVGGAIGAGNMFQINQSAQQFSDTFGVFQDTKWIFGLIVAVGVGAVIIGGIESIAKVTSYLVPFMTIVYVLACLVVLIANFSGIPSALGVIVSEAFTGSAAVGGFVGGLIQGIKRGVFSNEAGLGSAAIAHAPVKTRKPASEGVVALLEPFIDTVVVCLMTALVVVTTGTWKADASLGNESGLMVAGSATSETLQNLEADQMVKVLDTWTLVEVPDEGLKGYLSSAVIKETKNKKKVTIFEVSEDTALLLTPTPDAEKVGELKKATVVKVEEVWPWTYVRLKDTDATGFVLSEDLIDRNGWGGGIWLTSRAFAAVIPWFPYVLTIAVVLFAFSTMISWSFYGEQAISYLTKGNATAILVYKVFFCLCVVIGAGASLANVLKLSDAMYFAMVFPNLIGLYFLLPVVKKELAKFQRFSKRVDEGMTLDEAEQGEE